MSRRRQHLAAEVAQGVDEYRDELDERGLPEYCGDWCPCGANLQHWIEHIRTQVSYPPAPLSFRLVECN